MRLAQDAPRLSDNELKGLIEDVDHTRDRFEDALDGLRLTLPPAMR